MMKKLAFVGLLALSACETGVVDGQGRVVNINNTTGMTMPYFSAPNSDMNSWGPELLGPTTVLPSGRTTKINFADGTGACIYDFRARFCMSR